MEKREKRFGYSLSVNGYRRAVVPLERRLRVQCRIVTRGELPVRAHAADRAFAISRQSVAPRALSGRPVYFPECVRDRASFFLEELSLKLLPIASQAMAPENFS